MSSSNDASPAMLASALEVGPDDWRSMWGTDWTRAVNVLTYKQGVEAFRVTDRLSDA